MTPSIYDYRNGEIENARRIRRERRNATIEAAVCLPVLALAALLFVLACATA